MNLRRHLSALLCVFAAASLANAKPNVLLIVCDDLNTHVSTSGYPHIKTPHLDRLAKACVIFNRAYCQYPVCGPSQASFLSGLYPESTGVLSNKVDIRESRPGTTSLTPLMIYGGGFDGGRVIGQSDRMGGEPVTDAFKPRHLISTILRSVIDPGQLRLIPNVPKEVTELLEHPPITGLG